MNKYHIYYMICKSASYYEVCWVIISTCWCKRSSKSCYSKCCILHPICMYDWKILQNKNLATTLIKSIVQYKNLLTHILSKTNKVSLQITLVCNRNYERFSWSLLKYTKSQWTSFKHTNLLSEMQFM